jgi:hypothetical protein
MIPPITIAIQKPGELVGSILSPWHFCILLRRTQERVRVLHQPP